MCEFGGKKEAVEDKSQESRVGEKSPLLTITPSSNRVHEFLVPKKRVSSYLFKLNLASPISLLTFFFSPSHEKCHRRDILSRSGRAPEQ